MMKIKIKTKFRTAQFLIDKQKRYYSILGKGKNELIISSKEFLHLTF